MDAGGRATHDYMDIGDRAKQEARAEEQLPRAANNPASSSTMGIAGYATEVVTQQGQKKQPSQDAKAIDRVLNII